MSAERENEQGAGVGARRAVKTGLAARGGRRVRWGLSVAAVGGALGLVVLPPACVKPTPAAPLITEVYRDSFDRASIGNDWNVTSNAWSIVDGHLRVANARNHPMWLRRRLPRDARIEFDAWSNHPDGDIKCEAWGDGRSFARQSSYTATSYVVIFGGWRNSLNIIAREDEHAADRHVQPNGPRVEMGRRYHWSIERRGNTVRWAVDGTPFIEFDDPSPLAGPGHEHFAFNNWMVELGFDNLVITPL